MRGASAEEIVGGGRAARGRAAGRRAARRHRRSLALARRARRLAPCWTPARRRDRRATRAASARSTSGSRPTCAALPVDDDPVEFVCECGHVDCTESVRLTLDEYERVPPGPADCSRCCPGTRSRTPRTSSARTSGYVVVRKQPADARRRRGDRPARRRPASRAVERLDRRSSPCGATAWSTCSVVWRMPKRVAEQRLQLAPARVAVLVGRDDDVGGDGREAGRDLPDVQVVDLDDARVRGERACRSRCGSTPCGEASSSTREASRSRRQPERDHEPGDDERGDAVELADAGDDDEHAGDDRGDRARRGRRARGPSRPRRSGCAARPATAPTRRRRSRARRPRRRR